MHQPRWFASLTLGAVLGSGCGKVASSMPDAPPSAMCDALAAFGPPTLVAGIDASSSSADASLSADELTLYMTRITSTGDHEIYVASRPQVTAAFGAATPLASLNSTSVEAAPSISADGLTLMFQSDRITTEGQHLYVATRPSQIADFAAPALVAGVRAPVATSDDVQPFLTAHGEELWFTSNRTGNDEVFRAARVGASFANPAVVAELSSASSEQHAVLSQDRLTIYFSSNRATPGGAMAGFNIHRAHRTTVQDGFGMPTLVAEVNTSDDDFPTWLSADSCRLYLHSKVGAGYKIFMASRHPSP